MQRTGPFEKTLMLGKIEGGRRRVRQKIRLDGITDLMDMSFGKLQELEIDKNSGMLLRGVKESDMTERLNWTDLWYNILYVKQSKYNIVKYYEQISSFQKQNQNSCVCVYVCVCVCVCVYVKEKEREH